MKGFRNFVIMAAICLAIGFLWRPAGCEIRENKKCTIDTVGRHSCEYK